MCDKGAGHNASHFKILMQDNLCYDIIVIICESFVVVFQGAINDYLQICIRKKENIEII